MEVPKRVQTGRNAKRNYQRELDCLLEKLQSEKKAPSLFLHSCCAPCSSYVLEYLSPFFRITDFFYNPNITSRDEHDKRLLELKRLIGLMNESAGSARYPIALVEGAYEPERFLQAIKGLEHIPEGGQRCFACYRLRMEEAARLAAEGGYDYFTTTLSISPLKNAGKINEIGEELQEIYGVRHLPSDFKKKNGYLRSIELSREYDLYRQDYCGCAFSRQERERQRKLQDRKESSFDRNVLT